MNFKTSVGENVVIFKIKIPRKLKNKLQNVVLQIQVKPNQISNPSGL